MQNGVEALVVLYQSISELGHKIFAALAILCIAGFKGRENWISLYQTKNIYPSKLSCQRILIWCPSKKFGQWNKSERFVVLLRTIRFKGEVNFFISRGFLELFYLSSVFIGVQCLKRDFSFEKFQFWVSVSNHEELSPS